MVPVPAQLHRINGPILPVPGTNLRYSPTQATYIDPCNLYCKNLEHTIDDDALVAIFQDFGEIISARVITNGEGSRGHGFVSFAHPEEAARALAALNGIMVRGRPMYVRLHEPKQPRKNRLARQFGVGDTSGSDMTGTSNPSQPQTPRIASNELRAAVLRERHRSQSSSVDRNLSGRPSGATIDQELLSSLTGPARQAYVSDTMFRHLSNVPAAQNGPTSVGDVAAAMATLDVEEQIRTLSDRDLLDERVRNIVE
jgi:polyadenylate-binding protein